MNILERRRQGPRTRQGCATDATSTSHNPRNGQGHRRPSSPHASLRVCIPRALCRTPSPCSSWRQHRSGWPPETATAASVSQRAPRSSAIYVRLSTVRATCADIRRKRLQPAELRAEPRTESRDFGHDQREERECVRDRGTATGDALTILALEKRPWRLCPTSTTGIRTYPCWR